MNEQTTFVEPIKARKRVKTAPNKIASKIEGLANFYRRFKPDVKVIRISGDDAYSLREMWKDPKKQQEVRMAGFDVRGNDIHWRGFDLVSAT